MFRNCAYSNNAESPSHQQLQCPSHQQLKPKYESFLFDGATVFLYLE